MPGNPARSSGIRLAPAEIDRDMNRVDDKKDVGQPAVTPKLEAAPLDESPAGEGSVGYRIAAMVAMFLLALVTMVIWYYSR
jgi:hypothetical protein